MLESSGCLIDGIICDGAATNRKMWTQFGISGKLGAVQNYFIHPTRENRKVFVLSDVPHLFKNIKNRLHDKKYLKVIFLLIFSMNYVIMFKCFNLRYSP